MDRNFAAALKLVLQYEGGYVNHPDDPGGPTNKGITLATYRRFVNANGTIADLKAITPQEVAKVYRHQYWDAIRGDDLPDGVDFATFDFAVNSGPKRAAQYLQRVVGAKDDGDIGPATLAAVKGKASATVINDLCDKRLGFLQGLKTWRTFKRGWSDRVASVRIEANKMAAQAALGKVTSSAAEPGSYIRPEVDDMLKKIMTPEAARRAAAPAAPPPEPKTGWAALLEIILKLFKRN